MFGIKLRTALVVATALTALPVNADHHAAQPAEPTLEEQFQDPPNSARPRVWWHWMNGNISKDGIAKDLAWMKRVGIGGLQNFDVNLMTPQVVEKRLVYMTPEWKDAFRFTAEETERLGLELAIAASPGWSETGGPWVKPEDGLKKLVWTETEVTGGKRFTGTLAAPPDTTGPYQSMTREHDLLSGVFGGESRPDPQYYSDIAVLAFPHPAGERPGTPIAHDGEGNRLDIAAMGDGDYAKGVTLAKGEEGSRPLLRLDYPAPVTARSVTLYMPGAATMFTGASFNPVLEASSDGRQWRQIASIPLETAPTTISFAPETAAHFRIVMQATKPKGLTMSTPVEGLEMSNYAEAMTAMAAKAAVTIGEFSLTTEARVDRFAAKAGFSIEQDYYALGNPGDGATGIDPATVIDLTRRMAADGSLDWTPPEGKWRVLRLGFSLLGTTNHPAPPEATGLEVDKFDGDAVRRYIEHYLGMYREAAGGIGDKGVDAILTDSIEVGAANWTPKMIAQFRRLRGYDPTPWLPALTGTLIGTRAESDRFLYDYRRTLADLLASEHYGTIAKVAHENGLIVYGEALEDHRPSLGDDMAMRRHADIPMSALWTHSREEGPKLSYLADMKGAASVAHIYGQNLAAAESMTAFMAPWAFGPADLKRIIDLEFVSGINRPVVHTSVHVPIEDRKPGLSLFIFGQYFNRNEAWAELARPWVDYISRNSFLLQQGRNVADVGYFYGEEAPLTGLYGDARVADAPKVNAFDFVNFDALVGALQNDGSELITPGGARYKALYLGGSSSRMTVAALRRLAELVEGGARVIGTAPVATPSLSDDADEFAALVAKLWPGTDMARVGMGRVVALDDVEAGLRAIGVAPDFRFTGGEEGAEIPFVHRKLDDGEHYFLVNRKNRPERIEAHFRVTGKAPRLWHAETGQSEPVSYRIENGETIVPLDLAAEASVHVLFRQSTQAKTHSVAEADPVALARLDGAWDVGFQEGRGAPASVVMDGLAPLDEHGKPGVKYFSGIATYAKVFASPRGWKPGEKLLLDLGEVREIAEVLVNGQPAGYAWHAPYTLDIGAVTKTGTNRIEVRVANLWVNRLIGDAQEGAEKLTWTAMPTYNSDAPLRRSGLIGPVRLLGEGD
ncbi:MAG: glycosyl hydrolase [Novosphingobium sp.]|nr:glycosyl hydrolase [Novosphingobium sp.]